MDQYRPELDTCPACGSRGNCHIHGYYKRSIGEFLNGSVVWEKVTVMRVMCSSCGHTHAVLPDVIIPYLRHGLLFVLRVLYEHFSGRLSDESVCEKYGISRNQFYRWLHIFHSHKTLWLGILKSQETSGGAFMDFITSRTEYSAFASSFTCRYAFSFLQSHRNPADYCQHVFSP